MFKITTFATLLVATAFTSMAIAVEGIDLLSHERAPDDLPQATKEFQNYPVAIKAKCAATTAGTKKCAFSDFGIWGADWQTVIAYHYIELKQDSPNTISISLYYNYYGPVRAAFDPDVRFYYQLVNDKEAIISVVNHDWWRKCGNNNVNIARSYQSANLDAIKNLDHIDLKVQWRQDVKWCG